MFRSYENPETIGRLYHEAKQAEQEAQEAGADIETLHDLHERTEELHDRLIFALEDANE